MSSLYFASSNDFKFSEYTRIFGLAGITVTPFAFDIAELQSIAPDEIVRDKVLKAYAAIHRPVIVEHSSLSLSAMGGLPLGLTKPFWDILKDHISKIASSLNDTEAEMIVCMGFCDGKNKYIVKESVAGNIASSAVPGVFHLDRVFVPKGAPMALAGMNDRDRDIWSPRPKAAHSLIQRRLTSFLKAQSLGTI
jgi:XTP/dITP diphosphohydrolase